jgi:hypothetical protein
MIKDKKALFAECQGFMKQLTPAQVVEYVMVAMSAACQVIHEGHGSMAVKAGLMDFQAQINAHMKVCEGEISRESALYNVTPQGSA